MIISIVDYVSPEKIKNRSNLLTHSTSGTFLRKLNSIIEWEHCIFPWKLKSPDLDPTDKNNYERDLKFLGEDPELKPGVTFSWNSNVFLIVSETELALIKSTNTGWKFIKEFVENLVPTEFEFREDLEYEDTQVKFDLNLEQSDTPIEPLKDFLRLDYYYNKFFNERFCYSRHQPDKVMKIEVIDSEFNLMGTETLYYWKNKFFYPKGGSPEYYKDIASVAVKYLCKNFPRTSSIYEFDREDQINEQIKAREEKESLEWESLGTEN